MMRPVPLFTTLALALLVAACSSKTMVESDLDIAGAPDWVNEGTQVLKDKDGRLFHGVGSAQAMGDESLQISTADNRARAEIARVLSSYMEVAINDYSASATSDGDRLNEQEVERNIQNVSRINLTGARIIAHWKQPKTGTIYALAELDIKQLKSTLDQVSAMNAGLKDYIGREGENVFDKLAGEKP